MQRCIDAVLLTQHRHEVYVRNQGGYRCQIGSVFLHSDRLKVTDNTVVLHCAVHNQGLTGGRLFKVIGNRLKRRVVKLFKEGVSQCSVRFNSLCTARIRGNGICPVVEEVLNLFKLCSNRLRRRFHQFLRFFQEGIVRQEIEIVIIGIQRDIITEASVQLR